MSPTRAPRLLVYTDSREVGGAELAVGYLLGALDPRVEVGVLAVSAEVGRAIAEHRAAGTPVTVVRAPAGMRDGTALREHLRAVRAFAPDILHANQAFPWDCGYGEVAGLLAPGVRVLAVDHLPLDGEIPRVRRAARRLLARRLNAHVSVGEHAARLIERIVGLPAGSVGAIANGVPPRAEQAPAGPARRAQGTVVIGSLGRLTAQKGYDLLVRCLPELPGARLMLVGDGPERGALEGLARSLSVADRLEITGWSARARERLADFDVFALASGWEGMPLSILEAMHAGLPVLGTDVGSVAEAVLDGETGYVVAPARLDLMRDRLGRLVESPELRLRMGERGRAVAGERFTDAVMARRYEALYERLAGWG